MKVSVELTPAELRAMRAATRQRKHGEAVRLLAIEGLKLRRRHALSDKILAGEWTVDFPAIASVAPLKTQLLIRAVA